MVLLKERNEKGYIVYFGVKDLISFVLTHNNWCAMFLEMFLQGPCLFRREFFNC
jgi:hypothetical protein